MWFWILSLKAFCFFFYSFFISKERKVFITTLRSCHLTNFHVHKNFMVLVRMISTVTFMLISGVKYKQESLSFGILKNIDWRCDFVVLYWKISIDCDSCIYENFLKINFYSTKIYTHNHKFSHFTKSFDFTIKNTWKWNFIYCIDSYLWFLFIFEYFMY